MQPIFYFMLKKTSNHYEAEDLTQEVMCEILNALERGTEPYDFNAWVWRIARNRYARWVGRKNDKKYLSISDFTDNLVDDVDMSEDLVLSENLTYLRRELSLLRSDYSKIIAEYYFNNRSISDIAEMISLPIGTVKRKLHECRKHLKEGMKMSRTYGTRSLNPEDINFIQNWSRGEKGTKYVERKAPKNILLEAYDNPSTAEDLSLALGIAMPYMEEEIEILHKVGLLIKDKNKRYLTNCTIISKQSQIDVDNKLVEIGKVFNPLLIKTIDSIKNEKLYGGYQSFEDMKMTLIIMLLENLKCWSNSYIKKTPRLNDSEWDLMGFEIVKRRFSTCGLYGMSNILWSQLIVPQIDGIDDRNTTPFTDIESIALRNMINGDIKSNDIEHLETLRNRNFVKKISDGKYEPMFPVITENEYERVIKLYKDSHYDKLSELVNEYITYTAERYKHDIPAYLLDKPWTSDADNFRTCALEYAIETDYLKIPENLSDSAIGLWVRI